MSWRSIRTYLNEAYGHRTFDIGKFERWSSDKNIRTWSTGASYDVPHYLETGRSNVGFPNHNSNNPPYMDHVSFFKSTYPFRVWLVYHPYQKADQIADEVIEWAEYYGLVAEVFPSEYSWYHQETAMVVITTR